MFDGTLCIQVRGNLTSEANNGSVAATAANAALPVRGSAPQAGSPTETAVSAGCPTTPCASGREAEVSEVSFSKRIMPI